MGYQAYVLSPVVRERLLTALPPKFGDVIAHHVTHKFGIPPSDEDQSMMGVAQGFEIYGYVRVEGLEAYVVRFLNGTTKRPDGKAYHVTWSLDRSAGWKPVDSNRIIAAGPIVSMTPIRFQATLQYVA